MLDSDNIAEAAVEKKNVIKYTFDLIDRLTNQEGLSSNSEDVANLLNDIQKQPGLIKNIIFNLN
jgi:hypothetical protein